MQQQATLHRIQKLREERDRRRHLALTSKLKLVQEYRDHFHVIPKQSDIMTLTETELLAKMHRRWQRDHERRMVVKIQTRY